MVRDPGLSAPELKDTLFEELIFAFLVKSFIVKSKIANFVMVNFALKVSFITVDQFALILLLLMQSIIHK